MGSGTNQTTTCTRLLKRRYSVPEIIMRKHELAQQRPYDDYNTESVPSPKVPPSTGITNSSSTSSLSRNMLTNFPGSDGNLSRGPEKEISLRKSSLLRQMWEKESRQRNGKASSLRQKGFSAEGGDSHCEECRRLNISQGMDEMEPVPSKYFLNGRSRQVKKPPSTETSSSMSDVSQPNSQMSTQESLGSKQGQCTTTDASEVYRHYESNRKLDIVISDSQNSDSKNEDNTPVESSPSAQGQEHQEESSAVDNDTDSGDSALDTFISQMLIENLRDLAEEARVRCRKMQYIDCFKIKSNTSPDSEHEIELQTPDNTETGNLMTTSSTLEAASNEETGKHTTNTEESFQECTESTNESMCQIQLDEVPSADVVQINAGSTYQPYHAGGSPIIVPRVLKDLPRTESVEVQPSSASIIEEDNYCQNSDESLSLVDSLDDPAVEANDEMSSPSSAKDDQHLKSEDKHQKEKSQAFFVPIADSDQGNMEDLPVVAESMPDKLKERIEQRQLELDAKKECYKRIQHQMDENVSKKLESEVICEAKPKTKKNLVPIDSRSRRRTNKASKEMLRNDIGLLESYTVDSKGNLQFRPPQKSKTKPSNPNKNKLIKKQSIVTTRPPKPPVKSSTSSSSHSKKSKSSPKDIQKMTIFQTQSDIITPDEENGPRRIYQKTEIQDGEKRIEILEIVECVESSDDNSPVRQARPKLIAKSACTRRSRIPVPICKIGRSAGYQRSTRIREHGQLFGRSSPRDMQGSFSPRVDQAIAELLIGALNRSDQAVIEVIRSPKEIFPSRLSRGQITSRRSTPKRSSSSGKYRQIFEVIPEEKSSLSMDSSNEESSKDTKDFKSVHHTSTDANCSDSITLCSNTTKAIVTTSRTSTSSPLTQTPSRGREAVESIEPKAWIGFFKRHDNSQDEEEDTTTQPYVSSTTENSRQHTITSPSTATAAQGSSTPKNTSSATYPESTESDNILKVVEKTISDKEDNNFGNNNPNSTSKQLGRSMMSQCQKQCGNIIQVKECKRTNINVTSDMKIIVDEKDSHEPCQESTNVDVWRVQSPDICKRAIPKSKNCNVFEKCPIETTDTEIDTSSFIICSDNSVFHPSEQMDSSITLNDLHSHVECRKEFLNMCATCCFCNPDLHNTKSVNSEYCLYCNRKKTPQKKEEETNTESDYFRKQDVYQSTSIKDHTHTMSRDSDSVSTKCTRTNEKIKRYLPDSSRASNSESCGKSKKNINRPKNVNNLPKSERKSVNKVIHDDVKVSATQKKADGIESKFGPFPSPYKNLSSYGYEQSSSPTSSSDSTCPTTPERRILFPKVKCRANKSRGRKNKAEPTKDTKTEESSENKGAPIPASGTNTGWTVTLAGSCSQGPPPDVEMRLSFPKDQTTTAKNLPIGKGEVNSNVPQPISGVEVSQEYAFDNNGNTRRSSLLPPAVNVDSRRALPNTVTGGALQKDLIFPEVGTNSPRTQLVPRHMTKKAIRHLECNVAVTSATRTVSNFTRGRRTMSYQALNGDPQKLSSRERQVRDSSLDLGFLSSRRLSFESQSPLESMALSIMGNAIAPEQKPPVPTMSEKDLTRRHTRCFTRNRAFFT